MTSWSKWVTVDELDYDCDLTLFATKNWIISSICDYGSLKISLTPKRDIMILYRECNNFYNIVYEIIIFCIHFMRITTKKRLQNRFNKERAHVYIFFHNISSTNNMRSFLLFSIKFLKLFENYHESLMNLLRN